MRTRAITAATLIAFGSLGLAACGDDDGGGEAQSELGDFVVDQLNSFEMDFDEDCTRDIINGMSDEAAQDALDNVDTPDYDGFDETGERIEAECFNEDFSE